MGFHHVSDYQCDKCNEYDGRGLQNCESCGESLCEDCVELVKKVERKKAQDNLSIDFDSDEDLKEKQDFLLCKDCIDKLLRDCSECGYRYSQQQCDKCESYICLECFKLDTKNPKCWDCLAPSMIDFLLEKTKLSRKELLKEFNKNEKEKRKSKGKKQKEEEEIKEK